MIHMAAFAGTVTAGTALTPIPSPTDGWAEVQRNRLILPYDTSLLAAHVFGSSIGRAQIDAENFREVAPIDLAPIPASGSSYANMAIPFYPPCAKRLPKYSGISVQANDPLTTGLPRFGFLWFGEMQKPLSCPDVWTVFVQKSIGAVTQEWKNDQLSLVGNIPIGTYQLIGAYVINSFIQAVRFRFQNQTRMMGTVCNAAITDSVTEHFRRGGLGVWGTFKSTEALQFEYLGVTGTASVTNFYLDLIKIG